MHAHTHAHTHTNTHTHKHMHTYIYTQAHTHKHTQKKNWIHYNVTLQVPVKHWIFTRSPSSSVRTTLTMMYPVEGTSDHIDPI